MEEQNTTAADNSWNEAISGYYDLPTDTTTVEQEEEKKEEPVLEKQENGAEPENTNEDSPQEALEKATEEPVDNTPKPEPQPIRETSQEAFYKQQLEFERDRTEMMNDVLDKMGIQDKIIEGGEEITDYHQLMGFVNPQTQEAFTEEEAASWFLQRSQALHTATEQAKTQARAIADNYIGLKNGSLRVLEKYGEFLDANPELKRQLAQEYDKTLIKSDDDSLILRTPIDVEEFYDLVLKAHIQAAEYKNKIAELENVKKAADAEKQSRVDSADRGDIIDRAGVSGREPNLDVWAKAQLEYYNER